MMQIELRVPSVSEIRPNSVRTQINIQRYEVVGCFDELWNGIMQHRTDRA